MSTYSETFEDRVRLWLEVKYQVEYLGNLIYTTTPDSGLNTNYYNLSWGLNQETYPFIMQGDFPTEDDFYNYIVKQIAYTKFFETKRFIAYRVGAPKFIVEDFKDPLLTFDQGNTNSC